MKKRLFACLLCGVLPLLGPHAAEARALLFLNDTSTGAEVIILDGAPIGTATPLGLTTAADADLDGLISYWGGVGAFTGGAAGTSKPILGPNIIDLVSDVYTTEDGGILIVGFADTGFGDIGGTHLAVHSIAGSAVGTVSTQYFVDPANGYFTGQFGGQGPFGPGGFSGTASFNAVGLGTPFSISVIATVIHQGVGITSFATEVKVPSCLVPEIPPVVPDPDGYIDLERLDPDVHAAYHCFEDAVLEAGGTPTLTSAYRTPSRQEHLLQVWNTWKKVSIRPSPYCPDAIAEVWDHFHRHGLDGSQTGPAPKNGPHTRGEAVDVSVEGQGLDRDQLARGCGLYRPHPVKDKPHYQCLPGCQPQQLFYVNSSVTAGVPVVWRKNRTGSGQVPVTVSVVKTEEPGRVTYSYAVMNESPDSLTAIDIGYNVDALYEASNAGPQLNQDPIGWTPEGGIPSESATAPTGWIVDAFGMEETSLISVGWTVDSLGTALPPGHVLTGMSVTVGTADSSYESAEWSAYLKSMTTPVVTGTLSSTPVGVELPPSGSARRTTPTIRVLGTVPTTSAGLRYAFEVPARPTTVSVKLVDVSGRTILAMDSGSFEPGTYQRAIGPEQLRRLPSGLYFLSLHWNGGKHSARVIILR